MPYITVTSDDGAMVWRERVHVEDFDTEHFRTQLAERLRWGVKDAEAPGAEEERLVCVDELAPAAA